MANSQSVKAVAKYIRMSPHKIRRVIDQIRGRSYQEALMILEFLPYNAGGPIWQVVHSAAANAKHNYKLDKKKIAIELNGIIVPKNLYKKKIIKSSDKIEIVHFIGGG